MNTVQKAYIDTVDGILHTGSYLASIGIDHETMTVIYGADQLLAKLGGWNEHMYNLRTLLEEITASWADHAAQVRLDRR